MIRSSAIAAGLLLVSAVANADTPGLPPDREVDRALAHYPGVAAAAQRVNAARAEADMLRAGANEFTLSGSYLRRTVRGEGLGSDGVFDEGDATVSRTIRLPGKAGLDRKAGTLGVQVAENRGEDVHHHAALLLAQLWYDWTESGALYRTDADIVQAQQAAVAALEKRLTVRDAAQLEVDQARAALALAQAQQADSRARREKARATLAATFPEITLSAEPPDLPAPVLPAQTIATLHDLVIARSHEIRAADQEAERLAVLARRAHQDRIPDPTLGMRVFSERGGMEKGIGVVVSIPLGWAHRSAAASRASAEASAAGFDLADVRRQVQAMADADAAEAGARLAAWESMQASAQNAMAATARTERGYQLGGIDLADVLFSQRQANDARRAEVSARAQAARAITNLLIDSHTIWSADED
jgi:outer membrane protein TolC